MTGKPRAVWPYLAWATLAFTLYYRWLSGQPLLRAAAEKAAGLLWPPHS